ncbi:hypothetical protein BCR37DRAFT_381234 [Protomyces lactucae-debilis]|uniref:Uncharacterized protein n=1 Tax=Protomyces lactucae-debilis TaxID=2754530 RepID=A0A1Y2FB21_PROLT|nr:uncharacterized protein BCR37DRAFT_381234 [Protomyces lactucae-debilis]ORY80536.1 hypothetical protein BCR37DRAFT_381234 [Protomyces lactucae-debilis]
MSVEDMKTLCPDPYLASSAQYLRAWRKFVERIPRYLDVTVAIDAPPLVSFQLDTLKEEYICQVPGTALDEYTSEITFAEIFAEFLFPWHEQPALDKQQRARRLNEIYTQRPTYDETEFTIGDLKAIFRRIMPQVQADRFEVVHALHNLWIPDSFTVLSVWTDVIHSAGLLGFEVSLDIRPLRMGIDAEHSEITKVCPQYRRTTVDESGGSDDCQEPTMSKRQVCDKAKLCVSLNFLSPQHAAAWHKYVLRDSRFAKDPISYKSFVERATLAVIDSSGATFQCSVQSPLSQMYGEIEYTKLVEMFLVPDFSASRESRADAINDVYAARPDFDETQFLVDDLVTVMKRAVPAKRVEILHPRHHLPFPGQMPLCIVQQSLMKENQTRGLIGLFESVSLTIRVETAQSLGETDWQTQVLVGDLSKYKCIHDSLVQAEASDHGFVSAAE